MVPLYVVFLNGNYMVIMSVDYCDVRTGVAVCDKKEILASPNCVIKESYMPKLAQRLCALSVELKAEKIVIGLPRNMDGSYGYHCDACKELGNELANFVKIPIDYQDERLTTVIAHNVLSANNVKGKKRKENVDAVSAVMILQSYIDKNKSL